ncbi:MAG: c-type cytochrome [Janthinobacterium lividum]
MRTNFAGLFLAVGMGLIVVLIGLGALSLAGLVSFAPDVSQAIDAEANLEVAQCGNVATPIEVNKDYVATSAAEKAGEALFRANCAQCHAVDEKVVGPALGGITKRRSISWLVPWVHNSAKVVASGDEYAIKLFNDNGKQQMPSFAGLSEKEILDIITYVEASRGYQAVPDYGPVAMK